MRHFGIILICGVSGCVAFGGDPGELDDGGAEGGTASVADDASGGAVDAGWRSPGYGRDAAAGRDAEPAMVDAAADAGQDRDAEALPDASPDAAGAADAATEGGAPDTGVDAAPRGPPSLELGTSVVDGSFTPFAEGDDIPINSAGQAGVVLDLALRTRNMASDLFLTVTATPQDGEPVVVYDPGTVPRPFTCGFDVCEVTPFRVGTSLLGAPLDVVGMVITVEVLADDDAGTTATAVHTGALQPP